MVTSVLVNVVQFESRGDNTFKCSGVEEESVEVNAVIVALVIVDAADSEITVEFDLILSTVCIAVDENVPDVTVAEVSEVGTDVVIITVVAVVDIATELGLTELDSGGVIDDTVFFSSICSA